MAVIRHFRGEDRVKASPKPAVEYAPEEAAALRHNGKPVTSVAL